MAADSVAKFNLTAHRNIYFHGDASVFDHLRKLLKPYHFLAAKTALDLSDAISEPHFIAFVLDMDDSANMQRMARLFAAHSGPGVCRVAYAHKPEVLTQAQLLFSQEIGARFIAHGPERDTEFKEFLKRICVEAHHDGSIEQFEQDIQAAMQSRDMKRLGKIVQRLQGLSDKTESVLRLLVIASQAAGDYSRVDEYLTGILQLNSQNLWAANELGRQYMRSGNIAQGVEMLQRLSLFHELNSERLLTLGDAYAQAGFGDEAEEAFRKGDDLCEGHDERFKDGIAKAKIAKGDQAGALELVEGRGFSSEIVSFLNLRAIMSIRGGNFDEGMEYYELALKGSGETRTLQAKIYFNMGLAYARTEDLAQAKDCFKQSLENGGKKFRRAEGPLNVVKTIEKTKKAPKKDEEMMSDWEFETIY